MICNVVVNTRFGQVAESCSVGTYRPSGCAIGDYNPAKYCVTGDYLPSTSDCNPCNSCNHCHCTCHSRPFIRPRLVYCGN